MDEITPDLIAQIATRMYNAVPQASAMPLTEPPGMPEIPSQPTPAAMPEIGSLPGLAKMPSFGTIPSTPSIPVTPAMPAVPGPAVNPPGLAGFIQQIRQPNFGGRNQCIGDPGTSLREKLSLGRVIPSAGPRPLDVPAIRDDFPILRQHIHGRPLAWLDNAATTQKPQSVIDAVSNFYANDNSNIHRGAHTLAARATDAYEGARQKVQTFLGASSVKEIVFVRGTTEGINLITQTFGRKFLQSGDEIVMSTLEHHANIVPWQMIAKEKGAVIRVIPVNDNGEVMLEEYQKLLGPRTKVVALTHASNSLGTILPVAEMTQIAKRYNARVLIDGAQSVAHIPVNVQQLGCDFYVVSGHKIFGPTGIGAVFIKEELHDILPPWQGGGNMIRNVTFEETTYSEAPARFEAGTPNIADAVGLGAALDYVGRLGLPNIAAYEHELLQYATAGLTSISGLRLIGTAREKVGVLSFVLPNRRTEDIGRLLDQEGIAVRSGHHCSQPSLRRFGVESTVRPSLSFYNTKSEVDRLVEAVQRIQRMP
ncbi:MAG: SufS family cysteine desulfurase [Planctomycetaceae bacterium]|nr:SufS family cysteine desulfurase [Planctomycetaceae bacterium]